MASQLSEAVERDRVLSSRGRWNHVRSVAEAKTIMDYLFNLVSSARCELNMQKDARLSKICEENAKGIAATQHSRTTSQPSCSGEDDRPYGLRKVTRESMILNSSLNNVDLIEDMDTSDSELSDSEYEPDHDMAGEDLIESAKRLSKRRHKSTAHAVKPKLEVVEDVKSEIESEQANANSEKPEPSVCCSCSRVSTCTTKKCECRAAGGTCSSSCGCVTSKCANRASEGRKSMDEASFGSTDNVEDDKNMSLLAQGIVMLESAFYEELATENHDPDAQRKPLSDIGKTSATSNLPQPKREPVPFSAPDNSEATNRVTTADIPLRLPRAMNPVPSDSHPPLADRNSTKPDDAEGGNKEAGRRLVRPPRKATGNKENHLL